MQHHIPIQTQRETTIYGQFSARTVFIVLGAVFIDWGWVRHQPWPIWMRLLVAILILGGALGLALIRWPAGEGGESIATWILRIGQYYLNQTATHLRFWPSRIPPKLSQHAPETPRASRSPKP